MQRLCQREQSSSADHSNWWTYLFWGGGGQWTIWGPLPETARNNKHILVMMDPRCEAVPPKDQKTSTVPPILIIKIFSDRHTYRSHFESNLTHEICDVMDITKTRTTAYHPSGGGQVERQIRTLQNMLAAFVSKHRDDWDL